MNHIMEEVAHHVFDNAMQLAKIQAKEELHSTTSEEIYSWVHQEIRAYTAPLEEEINSTHSLWVKFRNRMYIKLAHASIDLIVSTIEQEISKLKIT